MRRCEEESSSALKKEAAVCSEKVENLCQNLWHHIPGDNALEIFTAMYILKTTIPEFSLSV
jgi:hypothetical protein